MKAVYTGHEALTYMDYLDAETGRTLTAEPGGTYDIIPAATGLPSPDLPPRFVRVLERPPVPAKTAQDVAAPDDEHQDG